MEKAERKTNDIAKCINEVEKEYVIALEVLPARAICYANHLLTLGTTGTNPIRVVKFQVTISVLFQFKHLDSMHENMGPSLTILLTRIPLKVCTPGHRICFQWKDLSKFRSTPFNGGNSSRKVDL